MLQLQLRLHNPSHSVLDGQVRRLVLHAVRNDLVALKNMRMRWFQSDLFCYLRALNFSVRMDHRIKMPMVVCAGLHSLIGVQWEHTVCQQCTGRRAFHLFFILSSSRSHPTPTVHLDYKDYVDVNCATSRENICVVCAKDEGVARYR